MSVLIIVDLQKEFFSVNGIFKENYRILEKNYIEKLKYYLLQTEFTIFIKSDYFFKIKPTKKTKTHKNNKCCIEKEKKEFINEINYFINENKLKIITKKYYSAFIKTELEEFLILKNISKIYLGGLTINTCIYHTALDAISKNYKVNIIKDLIIFKNNDLLNKNEEKFIIFLKSKNVSFIYT